MIDDLRSNFSVSCILAAAMFLLYLGAIPPRACATEIQWELIRELNVNDTVLDVAVSQDERWMYILTPHKILVYSAESNEIVKQIPVDEGIDTIVHTPQDNAIVLSGKSNKTIQILRIDHVYPFTIEGRPFLGNKSAPIIISIFSHYECPYCARVSPKLEMLLSQYPEKLRIVFKSFPSYQENARKQSAGAIAAFRQNKFWDFHQAIHNSEKPMPDGKIEEIASELNLDMTQFLKDMEGIGTKKIIDEDINEGLSAHVFSVPTFFINGKHIKNEKLNDIYAVIDSELKRLSKGN